MIRRVAVVVPVRDEEESLPRCLDALAVTVGHLQRSHPAVTVDLAVVLDGCRDGSAAVAARHGVDTFACELGCVGAVRHLGATALLGGPLPGAEVGAGDGRTEWLACTDADSVVPPHWLSGHLTLAEAGADVVVGTVEPVGLDDPATWATWRARHVLGDGHPHIHGANLGVRGSAYRALGGFAPLALGEDVDLVRRARARGDLSVRATDAVRVGSSARGDSRCEGGFSGYLTALRAEVVRSGLAGAVTGRAR